MESPEDRPPRSRGRLSATLRFVLLAVVIAGLSALTLWRGPDRESLSRTVDAAIEANGLLAPVVAIFGAALLATALVPRTLLALVGGLLFGWLSGGAYVLVGVTIGASVAFLVGRLLGRDFIAARLRGRLAQFERAITGRGILAVVISRLIPLVPFGVSNYAFGTTSIRFLPFVGGTLVGAAPATIAYAALGSATADRDAFGITIATATVMVLGICGTIGTYLVWRRRPRRAAAVDATPLPPAAVRLSPGRTGG